MNIRLGLVALATFSLACGGDEPKNTAPPPASGSDQAASAPAVNTDFTTPVTLKPDDGGVVHVMANDAMKYNTNRIEVSGQSVKIELKHVGEMPLEEMGHNLVVLKAGTDVEAFLKESNEAKATGYIPAGSEAVIANTKMLGGGDSDTIDVAFDGPGEYPFVCTFPPHGVMMRGVIVVQ